MLHIAMSSQNSGKFTLSIRLGRLVHVRAHPLDTEGLYTFTLCTLYGHVPSPKCMVLGNMRGT